MRKVKIDKLGWYKMVYIIPNVDVICEMKIKIVLINEALGICAGEWNHEPIEFDLNGEQTNDHGTSNYRLLEYLGP